MYIVSDQSDLFAYRKSLNLSVWSYGSVCLVHTGMKSIQFIMVYTGIKKLGIRHVITMRQRVSDSAELFFR